VVAAIRPHWLEGGLHRVVVVALGHTVHHSLLLWRRQHHVSAVLEDCAWPIDPNPEWIVLFREDGFLEAASVVRHIVVARSNLLLQLLLHIDVLYAT
jgi:hypothetical protein